MQQSQGPPGLLTEASGIEPPEPAERPVTCTGAACEEEVGQPALRSGGGAIRRRSHRVRGQEAEQQEAADHHP